MSSKTAERGVGACRKGVMPLASTLAIAALLMVPAATYADRPDPEHDHDRQDRKVCIAHQAGPDENGENKVVYISVSENAQSAHEEHGDQVAGEGQCDQDDKLADKEAEREERLAEKETEREQRLAEREAEREQRLAEKEAEREEKLAEKQAEKQSARGRGRGR